MFHALVPAAFQDIAEAYDIAVDDGLRVAHRVSDASLCSKVHDPHGRMLGEDVRNCVAVCDVLLNKLERWISAELRQPRALQRGIVIVIETIEAKHMLATRQEARSNVKTNESSDPGDKNCFHVSLH